MPLDPSAVAERLAGSPWTVAGDAIVRDIQVPDFLAAIALVNRVAQIAEELDHHPDILVHEWNHVRLTLSTHSAGGITELDLGLAERLDALA
ncbi:unannotated protein [freshwater metagenome]|uniref:4a-hydroxytetrahydrobiopterin dehydratase n=1 Tax=freshwater metagenome TaxID=449393 RepID=A0A6J7J2U5_9ZZZZ|nr:4a-hydroxytetrahydrobiopterin dehydratase [Actinomycetota bacterium]